MAIIFDIPTHVGGGIIFDDPEFTGNVYSITPNVTTFIAPQSTMQYVSGANIAGDITVSFSVQGGMSYVPAPVYTINGQTTVNLSVQASTQHLNGYGIIGQITTTIAVQAAMNYVEHVPVAILNGYITISFAPDGCTHYIPYVSGHMSVQGLVDRLSRQLKDYPNHRRWPIQELLDCITDAERYICTFIPEAYVKTMVVKLAPGTVQTVPNDSHGLLDIHRNMGSDGKTPGNAVTYAEKSQMDRYNPNWHTDPPSDSIDEFIYDGQDPYTWYNYPPVNGCVYVQGRFKMIPPAITSVNDDLSVKSIYTPAVYELSMYRAYSRDSEDSNIALAEAHLRNANQILGLKSLSDNRTSSRQNAPPASAQG